MTNSDETAEDMLAGFRRPPVFNSDYPRGFGTFYTAVYKPHETSVDYLWPNHQWNSGMDDFSEQRCEIAFASLEDALHQHKLPLT